MLHLPLPMRLFGLEKKWLALIWQRTLPPVLQLGLSSLYQSR